MVSPVDAAVTSSSVIGRYFAVVSVVPAALLVMYVTLLLGAGAWAGPLDPARIGRTIDDLGLVDLAWLIAAALVLALLIHPLKFAMTQLLEGYWGVSSVGLALGAQATKRHHRRVTSLVDKGQEFHRLWVTQGAALWGGEQESRDPRASAGSGLLQQQSEALLALAMPEAEPLMPLYYAHQAYEKARAGYPNELHRVMPTRLGNVLRRSEDVAGRQYGLDTLVIAPHLSLVAKPDHYAYVEDRQRSMDLSLTMCLVTSLATVLTALLLLDDGWWCLISFAPFAAAYTSYLGAVAAAHSYCVAIETVTDLSRFSLYEALHVELPASGKQEEETASALMALLRGRRQPGLLYATISAPPATTSARPPSDEAASADGSSLPST